MTLLRRVGFFRELSYGQPDDPSLRDAILDEPATNEHEVIEYLRKSPRFASAPMSTVDVLNPDHIIGQPSLHTDGTWVWTSDLVHYVKTYHLRLPQEFLEHVRSRRWQPPPHDEIGRDLSIEGFEEMSDLTEEMDEAPSSHGGNNA